MLSPTAIALAESIQDSVTEQSCTVLVRYAMRSQRAQLARHEPGLPLLPIMKPGLDSHSPDSAHISHSLCLLVQPAGMGGGGATCLRNNGAVAWSVSR